MSGAVTERVYVVEYWMMAAQILTTAAQLAIAAWMLVRRIFKKA